MGTKTRSIANNLTTGLGAPDQELLSNTTISSAAFTDITTAFSDTTYTNFVIVGSGINMASDNTEFRFNFLNTSGNAVGDTNYYWAGVGQRDTGSAVDWGNTATSYGRIIDNNASTGQSTNFTMTVFKPFINGHYTSFTIGAGGRRSGGGAHTVYSAGSVNTTDQIKGIRFSYNTGNISAGNLLLYGLRDS